MFPPRGSISRSDSWAVVLLLIFWLFAVNDLATFPPVYEDEPWIASATWKFAQEGVLGSDMFRGLNGLESRTYIFLPLFSILSAPIFSAIGLGLFQARIVVVMVAPLVLSLQYALGRRIWPGRPVAPLAMLLLVMTRTAAETPSLPSGLLFFDVARIARYDILVPMFGLVAAHISLRARQDPPHLLLSGILCGLATLSQQYGLFWFAALLAFFFWNRPDCSGRLRMRLERPALFTAGFLAPLLPYLIYVLADLRLVQAQASLYPDRFRLLDLSWYLSNLGHELARYGPGLGGSLLQGVGRIGFWATAIAVPFSVAALWRLALRGERGSRMLALLTTLPPLLLALFISSKVSNYLVMMLPLWALSAAWGTLGAYQWAHRSRRPVFRVALALLLVGVIVEGGLRISELQNRAKTATPYSLFIQRVKAALPPEGPIVGLHDYWFGLESYDYRTFAVPLIWANQENLDVATALERISPQAVIIDSNIREYFSGRPEEARSWRRWVADHTAGPPVRIDTNTYGQIEVYRRADPPRLHNE